MHRRRAAAGVPPRAGVDARLPGDDRGARRSRLPRLRRRAHDASPSTSASSPGSPPGSPTEHGVGKGDRVAIGMRNYPEWVDQLLGDDGARRDRGPAERVVARAASSSTRSPTPAPRSLLLDGERLERLAPTPRRTSAPTSSSSAATAATCPTGSCAGRTCARRSTRPARCPTSRSRPTTTPRSSTRRARPGAPEGRAGDAPQPRHEHHEHAAAGRRRLAEWPASPPRPRRPAAAGRVAAGLPVLPHRRPVRPVRDDGHRVTSS